MYIYKTSSILHNFLNFFAEENGMWTTNWAPWGECMGECDGIVTISMRKRYKACTNPINAGMRCPEMAAEEECVKCGEKAIIVLSILQNLLGNCLPSPGL